MKSTKSTFHILMKGMSSIPSVSRIVEVIVIFRVLPYIKGLTWGQNVSIPDFFLYQCHASVKSNFEHICAEVAEHKEPDICEFENMILDQVQQIIKNIIITLQRASQS